MIRLPLVELNKRPNFFFLDMEARLHRALSAGGAVAGGRIDGALLPVAYVEPPNLTADDLKRAAADREKRLRERAARLPGRAASAPKKE